MVCCILTEFIIIGESISVGILWSFAIDCRLVAGHLTVGLFWLVAGHLSVDPVVTGC